MSTYSPRQWAYALALLFGACFVICFLWFFFINDPSLKELYVNMFRVYYPGFSGFTTGGFINGFIQSIIWGLVAGWALAVSLNMFAKK